MRTDMPGSPFQVLLPGRRLPVAGRLAADWAAVGIGSLQGSDGPSQLPVARIATKRLARCH